MIPSAHHDPDRRAIDAIRRAAQSSPARRGPTSGRCSRTSARRRWCCSARRRTAVFDAVAVAVAVEADWPDALRVCRWLDRTRAVTPLDPSTLWQEEGEPQLAPTGM